MTFNCWRFKGGKSKGCSVCAIALLSFTVGSLITARLAHVDHVRADSNRVFEEANKLVEKIDRGYMRPTDFSPK